MKHITPTLEVKEIPYFQTPNDIFDKDLGLDTYQKIIYVYLCRCGNNGATAFPGYTKIAKCCGMGRTAAIKHVKVLIEKGLILKHTRYDEAKDENLSNVYEVDTDLSKFSTVSTESTPSTPDAPPPNEGGSTPDAPPSAPDAPPLVRQTHHPSAPDAPYKEPLKNNSIYKEPGKEERQSTLPNPLTINNKLLEFAKHEVQGEQALMWFKEMNIPKIDETETIVFVPNEFTQGIVDARYKTIIEKFLKAEFKVEPKVIIKAA